jgi:hypothetical protein
MPAPVSERQLRAVMPPVTTGSRARIVLRHQAAAAGWRIAGTVPGMRGRADVPRLQPLRTGSLAMYRFWKQPYGTPAKPHSLHDIPWDYVEANRDKIPFLGLREYW